MERRKFYSVLVCKLGEDYCLDNLNRILDNASFVFGEDTTMTGPYEEVDAGDVLLLSYNKGYVAYGIVTKRHISDHDHWNRHLDVDRWVLYNPENRELGISSYGIGWKIRSGSIRDVIKEVEPLWAYNKVAEINNTDECFLILKSEFKHMNDNKKVQKIIDILKGLKPQIILQGPPGTGKTILAQMVAKELSQGRTVEDAGNIVDDFFKTFDEDDEQMLHQREEDANLLDKFWKRFPKESLAEMTKEDYAIGTGSNDSFCWWMERGLAQMGKYAPGKSPHYLLYWDKQIGEYQKSSTFLEGLTDDEAAQKIAGIISEVVMSADMNKNGGVLGQSFWLKILNSYYPESFFPINAVQVLNNTLALLGLDSKGLNSPVEKNQALMSFFKQKSKQFNKDIRPVEFMRYLFNTFNLKENVIRPQQSHKEINKGEMKVIQFHPSFSYEDFVRGIAAKTDKGILKYHVENRILMKFVEKAINNPGGDYVLILDEINRANLPSVLGELIYALEYRYNGKNSETTTVDGLYEYQPEENAEATNAIQLPSNLYIIGTMNKADRSVGNIDYAIRRRFAFVNVPPSADVINEVVKDETVRNLANILFEEVAAIFTLDYLIADFKADEVQLGHSYFLAETIAQLELKLEYEIKPILYEYVKDGVLNEMARTKIEMLKVL